MNLYTKTQPCTSASLDLVVTCKFFLSGRPRPTSGSGGVALVSALDRHFAGRAPSGGPSPAAAAASGEEAAVGADLLEQGRCNGGTAAPQSEQVQPTQRDRRFFDFVGYPG